MSDLEWILIRATGMAAVVLLSAAMVLGLMLSLRMRPPRWPGAVTNDLHRFVTGLALWMTGVHILLLVIDSKSGIDLINVVVPFTTRDQAFAMGLGTLGVLALAVLWLTSVNRARIGYSSWRRIHHLAFGAYVVSMLHGLLGGTDTGRVWAWPVYLASAVVVGSLTALRLARRGIAPTGAAPVPVAPRLRPVAHPPPHATAPTGVTTPPRRPRAAVPDAARATVAPPPGGTPSLPSLGQRPAPPAAARRKPVRL